MAWTCLRRGAGPLALTLVCATGCVAENTTQSVTIQRALGLNTGCELDLTSTVGRGSGAYDVKAATGYVLGIEVANNSIEDRSSSGVVQSGRRVFVYQGMRVRLSAQGNAAEGFAAIPADVRSYDIPGLGTINPRMQNQGASTLGVGLAVFAPSLLADVAFKGVIAANPAGIRIIANLEAYGTMDGDDITSNSVGFPIDVCSGCLLQDLGLCSAIPSSFEFAGDEVCFPGQDAVVQCCSNTVGTATVAQCPGKGTMMTTTP